MVVSAARKKKASSSQNGDDHLSRLKSGKSMVSGEDIKDSLAETAEDRANYEAAAKLTDSLIRFALTEAKVGRKIYELCCVMDREMERLVQEDASRRVGIAFPCAVSTNDIICHLSPCPTDPEVDGLVLAEGDVVKIELGMHVATCPAFTCHTFVLGRDGETKEEVTGSKAALLMAAWTAAQATANQLRPGSRFEDIQGRLSGIAEDFGVKYTQGLMTHLVGKNMLAGDEGIIYRPTPDQLKLQDPSATVLPNQVFLVDVVMSNGEYGVARPTSLRTSIYKRSPAVAPLKLKASRAFLNQISGRHGAMAFALRWFGPEGGVNGDGRRRIALKECLQAELVHSYDVIADYEKDALTARFAFTIITGTDASKPCAILTHPPFNPSKIVTDKRPSPSTTSLLN